MDHELPVKTTSIFPNDIEGTLLKLSAVLHDEYCRDRMNLSAITGFIGELLVGRALQDAGYSVTHFGKQHGIDLEVPLLGVSIDVKTSLLKRELGCAHWGWALLSGSKNKALTFTHIVCVALNEDFASADVRVVARSDLDDFPAGIPPFINNKRILLSLRDGESLPESATTKQRDAVRRCDELEAQGKLQRIRDISALPSVLRSGCGAPTTTGGTEMVNVRRTRGAAR